MVWSFSAHPISVAIYFRRPECLKILLDARSSYIASYPDIYEHEIAHCTIRQLDGTPVGTEASLKVIQVLLRSREGQLAFKKYYPFQVSPLLNCLYTIRSAKCEHGEDDDDDEVDDQVKEEDLKRKVDALTKVATTLIRAGVSLTHRVMDVPLVVACSEGVPPEITSLLLKYGADPMDYTGHGAWTCLNTALAYKNVEAVKILLKHCVDVNGKSPGGVSPFQVAFSTKHEACLKALINHPTFRLDCSEFQAAKNDLTKEQLFSPEEKYYSFSEGNEAGIELDLDLGNGEKPMVIQLASKGDIDTLSDELSKVDISDMNVQSQSGVTAIHVAAFRSDIEMVELLIEKGSKIDMKDNRGYCPLLYAVQKHNSLEIMDLLISCGAAVNCTGPTGKTALFEATQANRIENAEHLCIVKEADVNIGESSTGTTPLHLMVQEDNVPMIEILLRAHTADVNTRNAFGASPMHYAAKSNARKAAKCLITKGASTRAKCTILGNTPLHVAAACNSTDVAHLLVDKGAHVNAKNDFEETPLFLAAMTGSESVLKFLLDRKAEVNARNIHGQTPLYIALNYQEYTVAKTLVAKGANIMSREKHWNQTILHHAVTMGNTDFIAFLIKSGADKEAKDIKDHTPFLRSALVQPYENLLFRREEIDRGKNAKTLLKLGCKADAKLEAGPVFNFLNLLIHNKNIEVLETFFSKNKRTKKFQLNPLLKNLSKVSKDDALELWEHVSKEHPGKACCGCHCDIYDKKGW